MVSCTLIRLAQRVPLIKFRKGGKFLGGAPASGGTGSVSNTTEAVNQSYRAAAIEDWELPPRYSRKQISADEMEYINRGGPA